MSVQANRIGGRARVHVPELDGVRGLAIALVMALHFVSNMVVPTNFVERAAVKATSYGLWGVDLFFVLSGFLITGILADSRGTPGYFRNFFAKRTLRIFPLYYGVLLLLTVIIPASVAASIDPELLELRRLWPWLWLYLTNFYLGPETTFSIPYLSHFWSLAIEEHFYLAWPFVIWWLPGRSAMRVCLALGAAALLLRIGFSAQAPEQLYAGVLTPCRIDALCAGAWFALAARTDSPFSAARAVQTAWLAAGAALALSLWHVTQHSGAALVLPLRTSALAVLFGAVIYGVTYHDGLTWLKAGFRMGWLRHLGKYSYGLYVFHGIIAYGMHRYGVPEYINTLSGVHMLNSVLLIALGVSVSYVISAASYHGFELPFLSLKKRFSGPALRPAFVLDTPGAGSTAATATGGARPSRATADRAPL